MNKQRKFAKVLTLTATLLSTAISGAAVSTTTEPHQESTAKLLSVRFEAREVVKIEAGDFHFVAGQVAPIHTHDAPAIGYVSKGEILYQVEGEKPQLLREGDAFYEPVGPRILRFDNASATEEAIFIDFNLQQENEPFIVFEKELTEHIDRRTLPTIELKGKSISQADVLVSELEASGHKTIHTDGPTLGYVAEGTVNVITSGKTQQYIAGQSFSLVGSRATTTVVNNSSTLTAKVVAFHLK